MLRGLYIDGRQAGILPVLVALGLIVLVVGVQYYIGMRMDEEDAVKIMDYESTIVQRHIMAKLKDAEIQLDEMHEDVVEHIDDEAMLKEVIHKTVEDAEILKSAAIAFVPGYFPEKGNWYEPATIRLNHGELVDEQVGGLDHDYTAMSWYIEGLTTKRKTGVWSRPYIDFEEDKYIMTLSRSVVKNDSAVAVVCVDVELAWLKSILADAEPYEGSVCTLKDQYGNVITASGDTKIDEDDYFIATKKISVGDMEVTLACPREAIHGHARQLNAISFVLLLLLVLLPIYIVGKSVKAFFKLHTARQQQMMVEREMHLAHDIQMDILRTDFPRGLNAMLLPMKEVGGDLYDFWQHDNTLYFIIGDVSGKGIPAAMMMAATVNLFRMAAHHYATPVEIMNEINHVVAERNPNMIFVTAFVGKLDMQHGLLTYCNAGHNPPLLNGYYLSTDPDIPLGYQHDYTYRQYGSMFSVGSRMVLYTDGITEARNRAGKLMGIKRLQQMVDDHAAEGVDIFIQSIIDDTHSYAGHSEPTDDMTIMCVENTMPQRRPSLSIVNDIDELRRVKILLNEYCDCLAIDKRLKRKIMLAVEEAVANVIAYSYPHDTIGMIDIDIRGTMPANGCEGMLQVTMIDKGAPFDPTSQREVDVKQNAESREVGGLGIFLFHKLMDEVNYERTPDGENKLVMTKILGQVVSNEQTTEKTQK